MTKPKYPDLHWKCPSCPYEVSKPTGSAIGMARMNHESKVHGIRRHGTGEWASGGNKNLFRGCRRRCRYCYRAYDDTVRRKCYVTELNGKKRHMREDEWVKMEYLPKAFNEKPKKVDGRLFFYSGHDIFPDTVDICIEHMKRWLEVGNEILIVTKPMFECVETMCKKLQKYKKQITFRFTIGSQRDENLRFWDGGDLAPLYDERRASLIHAFYQGYKTSVSCEPFFDDSIVELVHQLLPYVTDTIWVGLMNRIKPRVNTKGWSKKDFAFLEEVRACQSKAKVMALHARLYHIKKVRFKDSITTMLGLEQEAIG